MTIRKIIDFLIKVGEERAAEKLKHYYLQKDFKIRETHKRVLLLLFVLGTLDNPLKVPLRKTAKGDQYNYKRAFWQAIEWLLDRTSNSFKARFQELKEYTDWVDSPKTGIYQITTSGILQARELLTSDYKAREFFMSLVEKLYKKQDKRAKYLRGVLIKTGNFAPLSREQINYLLASPMEVSA